MGGFIMKEKIGVIILIISLVFNFSQNTSYQGKSEDIAPLPSLMMPKL